MSTLVTYVITKCGSKKSIAYLRILSFIESIFFPIPTDVLLAPMVLSKKHNWIHLAFTASVWSVLGGIVGYFLGFYFFELVKPYLYEFGKYDQYISSMSYFDKYGILFLFISAFTPVPYKIFTISAGVLNYNLILFIIISLVGRSARFFLVSFICERYDEKILDIVNKYLMYFAFILLVIIILLLWI